MFSFAYSVEHIALERRKVVSRYVTIPERSLEMKVINNKLEHMKDRHNDAEIETDPSSDHQHQNLLEDIETHLQNKIEPIVTNKIADNSMEARRLQSAKNINNITRKPNIYAVILVC